MLFSAITYRHSNASDRHSFPEEHSFVGIFDGEQYRDLDHHTCHLPFHQIDSFVFSFVLILFVDLQILLIDGILSPNEIHDEAQLTFCLCDGTPVNVYCQRCDLKLIQ